MATNNVTIDYNNLTTFHPATIFPGVVDQYFTAYPVASMFYKVALAGSLMEAMKLKSMSDYFTGKAQARFAREDVRKQLRPGAAHYEIPVRFAALSGTVNGPGLQTITNTPVSNYTKARFGFNRKYTPAAIPEDEWELDKVREGGSKEQMEGALDGALSQLNSTAGAALATQLELIETEILGTNTSEDSGVLSLAAAYGTSASDTTTYGGISRSSVTAWVGNFDAITDANWQDMLSADFSASIMGYWEDIVIKNGAMLEDLVWIMGATKYQYHRRSLTIGGVNSTTLQSSMFRWMLDKDSALPHTNLASPGGVPIIRADKAGASTAYLVDTKSTYMIGPPSLLFKLNPWQYSESETKVHSRIKTFSNVVCDSPRRGVYIAAS